jgi:hypothetical protein
VGRLREEMGLGLGPRGKEGRPRGEKRGGERARRQREEGSVLGWAGSFYSFFSFAFLTH